ncbi:hypothetical protein [Marinicella rhabdoformis]|uniref:hypothetical protein n=1 Tax=Marinicella rhabdoformis TaxID=2580566 RepID=UPI0012AEDD1E|nr:hypothetical protein [Marinicella rhabdoformis]
MKIIITLTFLLSSFLALACPDEEIQFVGGSVSDGFISSGFSASRLSGNASVNSGCIELGKIVVSASYPGFGWSWIGGFSWAYLGFGV